MAKKASPKPPPDPIVDALDAVTASLKVTTEILRDLMMRLHGGEAPDEADGVRAGRPIARTGEGRAAQDEAVLRELAGTVDLTLPMDRLIALRNTRFPNSRPRYWAVVNFDLHSSKPRMFVFDVSGRTVGSYLCAHGKGSEGPSDDGRADVFSNESGSKASSLGIYRCAETYVSEDNGYSLRLDGLESTNSNARSRLIVVHGADYVSDDFVRRTGRTGRSEGCPALDHRYARTVIDQLKQGSLLIHWRTP